MEKETSKSNFSFVEEKENSLSQYTMRELESFAKAIKKASDIIKSKSPDYIFAPVIGSIPLIDFIMIADRHFPLDNVEYPPNSSRFAEREKIIRKWYNNFLKSNYRGQKIKIICIDEVISGSSALKGYNEFQKSLWEYGKNIGNKINKKISYEIIGIGERPYNGSRNNGLSALVNGGKMHIVETEKILTADNISLNPARLKVGEPSNKGYKYEPEIISFEHSQAYLKLLKDFAQYHGVDPHQVRCQNLIKINESLKKFLSN